MEPNNKLFSLKQDLKEMVHKYIQRTKILHNWWEHVSQMI